MKGLNLKFKKILTLILALFMVLTSTSSATPFISTSDIPDKINFETYITKMYDLDEGDPKYIDKLENAIYDYKNRYTMYVDHDYVLGKPNPKQSTIVYYQPGVQDPPSAIAGPGDGGGGDGGGGPVGVIDAGEAVTPPCGEWYNSCEGMEVDHEGQELYGGIKLYTALPWEPDAGTYFFDTDVSTEDAYNWVNSQGGFTLNKTADWAKTANGRICKGVGYTVPKYLRGPGWYQKEGAYVVNLQGVECVGVAPPPCVVDPNYNNGFAPGPWQTNAAADASKYNYGQKRMAVVLEGGGGTVYLPATCADAKGHTFPGGVFQTNCKAGGVSGNVYSVYVAATSGDAGGGVQTWPGNQIAQLMNTVSSAGSPPVAYTYNVCETYCWSSKLREVIQSGYRVIGYVVWP